VSSLLVHPASNPLRGSVPVPGDKSITHRALLLASIASASSVIRSGGFGEDTRSTIGVLRALGVSIDEASPSEVIVHGAGLHGLCAPSRVLDCGNSGTTMRLAAGLLAGQRFASRLVGDASLSRRPMSRVANPLRLRGARIEGQADPRKVGEITAPLEVGPLPAPGFLSGLEHELSVASAQVKSALLVSGLYADEPTYVREPVVSRDHTERMLAALGVPISAVGAMVALDPGAWSGELPAFSLAVPGDPSSAAFLAAAATLVEGSRVDVRRIALNLTRTGFFEVLRDMGGRVQSNPLGEELGEPIGDVMVASAELGAARIGGEVVPRAIDEIPILCALSARAHGITTIGDAAELRVKESDRLGAMARVLGAFGVRTDERPDGLVIEGAPGAPLRAADVASEGDHRIAMTAAVLALVADGPSRIRDADCIATSFPRFVGTLRALGARIDVEPS